ncbi:MAG: hypothetical protein HFG53_04025 [Lachnospiraceae bacterium]|jgi:hypothetical protein|nr:hypothetical protein [Lachnospiraceae bacterium]
MENVFLWGTGFIANQILNESDIFYEYHILGFIDNDINKAGTSFYGKRVFSSDILYQIQPDKIIVLTDCYVDIRNQILQNFPQFSDVIEDKNYFYKQRILERYKYSINSDIINVLKYLQKNNLQVFNYDFVEKYKDLEIEVLFDKACGMYYVHHNKKKLYFAKRLKNKDMVKEYYKNLLIEQDEQSPHRYLNSDFAIQEGAIVADVGVAEGNFSLDIIEKVSKLYLIETDEEWIEAVRETFKAYLDKIVIIKKYITSINAGRNATLDSQINEPVDFIKMDIEGNEWDALLGAKKLIGRSSALKCAICAYHGDFDETLIKDALEKYGMSCSTTPGYMWFPDKIRQTYVSTRLCRGIVRGVKQ